MQFGIPVFLDTSLEETAAFCKQNQIAFIELNSNFPTYHPKNLNIPALKQLAAENEIYFTFHLDDKLSPCDFDDGVAAAYTQTVLDAIEIAKKLEIPILNIHLSEGGLVTLPTEKVYLFDKYHEEYASKLTKFRTVCERAIGNAPIKICIENYGNHFPSNFMQKSLEILTQSDVFGITYDIGHNVEADYADEPHILKYAAKGKLHHFHIHDAIGKSCHLPLGEGTIDIAKYIDIAKENNCRAVVEVKTIEGARQSIDYLKEKEMF